MNSQRVRAYIGLGANLGDAAGTLAWGVRALAALPDVRIRGASRLYATAPVGVVDQPEFRNAVVGLDLPRGLHATNGALRLLEQLKALERDAGRRRRRRWGPRELDLDLLVFGRARLDIARTPASRSLDVDDDVGRDAEADQAAVSARLVVPHPAAAERLFVLAPLADLAPGLVPPGWGETVETARRRRLAVEGPDAVRAIGEWGGSTMDWRPIAAGQPR